MAIAVLLCVHMVGLEPTFGWTGELNQDRGKLHFVRDKKVVEVLVLQLDQKWFLSTNVMYRALGSIHLS